MRVHIVKLTKVPYTCRVNIPQELAKEIGFVDCDYVAVRKISDDSVEVIKYDAKKREKGSV